MYLEALAEDCIAHTYRQPYVSCFESLLDEEAYEIASHGLGFNLPANLTAFSYLRNDVLQQTSVNSANMESLARKCIGRSGEVLPYVGR